jgi:hypothetical protein
VLGFAPDYSFLHLADQLLVEGAFAVLGVFAIENNIIVSLCSLSHAHKEHDGAEYKQ